VASSSSPVLEIFAAASSSSSSKWTTLTSNTLPIPTGHRICGVTVLPSPSSSLSRNGDMVTSQYDLVFLIGDHGNKGGTSSVASMEMTVWTFKLGVTRHVAPPPPLLPVVIAPTHSKLPVVSSSSSLVGQRKSGPREWNDDPLMSQLAGLAHIGRSGAVVTAATFLPSDDDNNTNDDSIRRRLPSLDALLAAPSPVPSHIGSVVMTKPSIVVKQSGINDLAPPTAAMTTKSTLHSSDGVQDRRAALLESMTMHQRQNNAATTSSNNNNDEQKLYNDIEARRTPTTSQIDTTFQRILNAETTNIPLSRTQPRVSLPPLSAASSSAAAVSSSTSITMPVTMDLQPLIAQLLPEIQRTVTATIRDSYDTMVEQISDTIAERVWIKLQARLNNQQ
jgi:hypothetical protein